MSDHSDFIEPTHPLPFAQPGLDGVFRATTVLSPVDCKSRARLPIPPSKVIPVIFIPGIMGSNLRATTNKKQGQNAGLKPGEAAWRPPNGNVAAGKEFVAWINRKPALRQKILDPDTLEVDGSGEVPHAIEGNAGFIEDAQRSRGWGEVYCESYGPLLCALVEQLNSVFRHVDGKLLPKRSWIALDEHDRALWNVANAAGATAKLTQSELTKVAQFHYPVYAMGYNWLQSNEQSATRLENRIAEIINYWSDRKQQCTQVILVTHSMGGLVARACAKRIPDKILGVVHGVMPALGAPVCYRRIACGTEAHNPSAGWLANAKGNGFAIIAGSTAADTTAVMATAPGPLELLPNEQYPKPWLFATFEDAQKNRTDTLNLPNGSAYAMYRDTKSWFRMIDPALADPAQKFHSKDDVSVAINDAIKQAERFHNLVLGEYYHPNTYAFYGNDKEQLAFGSFKWLAERKASAPVPTVLASGIATGAAGGDGRTIKFSDGTTTHFTCSEQDIPGDGTVPQQSGMGAKFGVKEIYLTKGYDHQGSYGNAAMLALTVQLIARIVQAAE